MSEVNPRMLLVSKEATMNLKSDFYAMQRKIGEMSEFSTRRELRKAMDVWHELKGRLASLKAQEILSRQEAQQAEFDQIRLRDKIVELARKK